jgi:hypothetical protein
MQYACLTRPARRSASRKEPVAACALHEAARQDRELGQQPTLRIVFKCHAQVTRCVLFGSGYELTGLFERLHFRGDLCLPGNGQHWHTWNRGQEVQGLNSASSACGDIQLSQLLPIMRGTKLGVGR